MAKFIFMRVLGMMSGTSLDGLDLCLVRFYGQKKFNILKVATVPYSPVWKKKIADSMQENGLYLARLQFAYSRWVAQAVLRFIRNVPRPELLVFSGHTVFHNSAGGYTYQLGLPTVLSALTGYPVVGDLRSADVALGGEGAPLVPCGEFDLFPGYPLFLNLGGICNASFRIEKKIFGKDLAPCNMALNYVAEQMGFSYDRNGRMAAGNPWDEKLAKELFQRFQNVSHSLGREDFICRWLPVLEKANKRLSRAAILSSLTRAIALCITFHLRKVPGKKVMVTGGGALNRTLVNHLRELDPQRKWIVPDFRLVKYKEALIFARLGYRSWKNKKNILSSVTGCSKDHTAGCIARVL